MERSNSTPHTSNGTQKNSSQEGSNNAGIEIRPIEPQGVEKEGVSTEAGGDREKAETDPDLVSTSNLLIYQLLAQGLQLRRSLGMDQKIRRIHETGPRNVDGSQPSWSLSLM